MKTATLIAAIVLCSAVSFGDVTVTVTSVRQNWPWDAKVTIGYTLSGAVEKCNVTAVSVKCRPGREYSYGNVPLSLSAIRGDIIGVANGAHEIVWDPALDTLTNVVRIVDAQFVLSVAEEPAVESARPEYLVIDLSGGASASSWPATAVDSLDPTADECKTTKLVLRRIRPGTFLQSSPADEPLRNSKYENQGEVTLTNDYWIGVYELTQRQYELMTGTAGDSNQGGAYPRHSIKFSDVRGTDVGKLWPESSDVDEDSLVGRLRSKVALPAGIPDGWKFDLPTEAQWEYACRAGTTTTFYWGNSMNGNYAWYGGNSSGTAHVVGTKVANAWGLYDMSGNVREWCLDWAGTLAYGTDPKGSSSGLSRGLRGGSWNDAGSDCTSSRSSLYCGIPSRGSSYVGFRLARTLSE